MQFFFIRVVKLCYNIYITVGKKDYRSQELNPNYTRFTI